MSYRVHSSFPLYDECNRSQICLLIRITVILANKIRGKYVYFFTKKNRLDPYKPFSHSQP